MTHSFLLIGQSNAAGRGFFEEAEALDNLGGRLKVLRNGRWQPMFRPVNPDRYFSGTSLAESFAAAYAETHADVDVGIIPCADGGTAISQWEPGSILFDNALFCAKLAMRTSVLKGIIWHQGEGDCNPDGCALYTERFLTLMNTLRKELGKEDLPILVGGLGDFLVLRSEGYKEILHSMNGVLRALGEKCSRCAFVSAEGLGANPDNLHFSAAALKEFGLRYYKEFEQFDDKNEEEIDEKLLDFDTKRTAMEFL